MFENLLPIRALGTVTTSKRTDVTAPLRFKLTAYDGGLLGVTAYLKAFQLPVVLNLAGVEFARRLTINLNGNATKRLGHIEDSANDGRSIKIAGVMSGSGPDAMAITEDLASGKPWRAYIEALPLGKMQKVESGQAITINGRQIYGPVMIAKRSKVYGVAFTKGEHDGTKIIDVRIEAIQAVFASIDREAFRLKGLIEHQELVDWKANAMQEARQEILAASHNADIDCEAIMAQHFMRGGA
jgi:hypothetical protein